MLLSEPDAKTKECREGGPIPIAASLPEPGDYTFLPIQWPTCAASGCMHWRWGEPDYEHSTNHQDRMPDGDGWEWKHVTASDKLLGQFVWRRILEPRGYCGLAGRP